MKLFRSPKQSPKSKPDDKPVFSPEQSFGFRQILRRSLVLLLVGLSAFIVILGLGFPYENIIWAAIEKESKKAQVEVSCSDLKYEPLGRLQFKNLVVAPKEGLLTAARVRFSTLDLDVSVKELLKRHPTVKFQGEMQDTPQAGAYNVDGQAAWADNVLNVERFSITGPVLDMQANAKVTVASPPTESTIEGDVDFRSLKADPASNELVDLAMIYLKQTFSAALHRPSQYELGGTVLRPKITLKHAADEPKKSRPQRQGSKKAKEAKSDQSTEASG